MKNVCPQFFLLVCSYWLCLSVVEARFKFLTSWPPVTGGTLGRKTEFDCSTNDPNATTELWKIHKRLTVAPGRLIKDGDVYTIPKTTVRDSAHYTCKAVNKIGTPIQKSTWRFLSHVVTPKYDHEPKTVQVRQVGESVKFQLTATLVIPVVQWGRFIVTGGKDSVRPITASHNITEIRTESSLTSILTLKNLILEDGGYYAAVAKYQENEHSQLFSVQVYAPTHPVIIRISANSTISESKEKMLECAALGYPPPELLWFKDGVEIPLCKENCNNLHYQRSETHHSGNSSEGFITIRKIIYSDNGVYKCAATNVRGRAEAISGLTVESSYPYKLASDNLNKTVMVDIAELKLVFPSWSTVSYQRAYVSGGTRFNCTTSEDNVNTTLWFANHLNRWTQRFPDSKGKLTKINDVFTLTDINWSDSGKYMCRAKILIGGKVKVFPTEEISLTLIKVPTIKVMVNPRSDSIMTGEDFNISCETSIIDNSDQMFEWFTEDGHGKILNHTITKYQAYKYNKNRKSYSVLMIKNAEKGEVVYGCKLTAILHLDLGRKETAENFTRLYVKDYEPLNVTVPSTSYVNEFSRFSLSCEVTGFPQPNISWYKNGYKCGDDRKECGADISPAQGYFHHNKWIGTLVFTSPSFKSDMGNYTCRAANKLESRSATTLLVFYGKPVLGSKESRFFETEGRNVKMECKISRGFPLPTFAWFYLPAVCDNAGCKPDESGWTSLPQLLVKYPPIGIPSTYSQIAVTATEADIFYKCVASNTFGKDNTVYHLVTNEDLFKVQVKPDEATVNEKRNLKITCIDINDKFARLNWFRNEVNISAANDPRFKVEIIGTEKIKANLWILNTALKDSGKYTCVAETPSHTTVNQTVRVTVAALVSPKIRTLPVPGIVENNSTWVALTCNVSANPMAVVKWIHDGKNISLYKLFISNTNFCKSRKTGFYYFAGDKYKNTLVICHPNHSLHTGNYTCIAKNSEGEAAGNIFVDVLAAPKLLHKWPEPKTIKLKDTLNVTCSATGNPQARVEWKKLSDRKERMVSSGIGKTGAKLYINSVAEDDFGRYLCVAWNDLGDTSTSLELRQASGRISASTGIETKTIYAVVAGCVVFIALFLVIIFIVVKRQSKKLDALRRQNFDQFDYKLDPDRTLLEQAGDLPYDLDWEFPEVRLTLGESIGSGAFGQVFRAEALGIMLLAPRDKTPEAQKQRAKLWKKSKGKSQLQDSSGFLVDRTIVAVKTLKDNATEEEYKNLALELKIMIHLGEHHNIINVLGASTKGKNLKMIIEFAPHGNLLNFLRGKREIYEPVWTKTQNNPEDEFTLVDQVSTAYHVSCGMEYLASKKCVHRDLAARNVLVGNNYVAKIADFGLARDVCKDDNYVMTSSGLLPIKWMAPESIFDRIYTEKSDAWSFGILCWELFTLGGTPYPGVPPAALVDYLNEGQRMPRPRDCPSDMYAIMKDCWTQEADRRPKFTKIAQRIARILNKSVISGRESLYVHLTIADEHSDNLSRPCDSFRVKSKRSSRPDDFKKPHIQCRVPVTTKEDLDSSDDEFDDLLTEPNALLPPDYDDVVSNSPDAKGREFHSSSDDSSKNTFQRSASEKSSDGESGICVEDVPREPNKHQVEVEMNMLGNSELRKNTSYRRSETLV